MAAPVMNNSVGLSLYAALSPSNGALIRPYVFTHMGVHEIFASTRLFTFKANEFVH